MRFPWCRLLVFAALLMPAAAAPAPDIRLKHGDDARWAAPDWDDSDWQRIDFSEFPARTGIYWVRIRLVRPAQPTAAQNLDRYSLLWPDAASNAPIDALFFASVYSFELYFNGRLLARGGVVGNDRESEVPGRLDNLVRIPEELLKTGEHLLAVRMSTYRYNFPVENFSTGFQPVNFAQRLRQETLQPVFPLIGAAGSLLMAATSLVLFWFIERRRVLWLVGLVSLVLAVFYGLIAVRWLYPYSFEWHYPRLLLITWVLSGACVLLVWLLLEQFVVPRKVWCLAILVPLLAAAWQASTIYELKVLWICRAMLVVALGVTVWAAWQRRPGARLALAGVVVALLGVQATRRVFLDPTFFLMIEGLVLLVFAAIGAQVQAERRLAREAKLTAARLETELLKKNLQPHFLLNTLTALTEVIERDPAGAAGLIEDLAGVLRALARMSGEKLVTLDEELALCRSHLRVVAVRTAVPWTLAAPGVVGTVRVPPAVFLTLIENGLVHQELPAMTPPEFVLQMEQVTGTVRFRFVSPGRVSARPDRTTGGTGLRYVQARLEESFSGQWTFAQQAEPGGWETTITFPELS